MVDGIAEDIPQSKRLGVFSHVGPLVAGFVGRFSLDFGRGKNLNRVSMIGMAAEGTGVKATTDKAVFGVSELLIKKRIGKLQSFFMGTENFDEVISARRAHFHYLQGSSVALAMSQSGSFFSIT